MVLTRVIGDATTRRAIMNKKPEAPKPVETVPFFARKVDDAPLVVRSGVRAGLAEQRKKHGAREDDKK